MLGCVPGAQPQTRANHFLSDKTERITSLVNVCSVCVAEVRTHTHTYGIDLQS